MSQSTEHSNLVVVAPPKKTRYNRHVSQPAEDPIADSGHVSDPPEGDDDEDVPVRASSSA